MLRDVAIALLLALLAGCGGTSRLLIRHNDPGTRQVDVRVDEEAVGSLAYGDALYINLDPGYHRIDVRDAGSDDDPWSDEGRGWEIFIESEATLSILEETPAAPAAEDSAADKPGHRAKAPTKQMRVRTLSRRGRARTGFTLQLGVGAGYQAGEVDGERVDDLALGGFGLGVGAFVTPWTTLQLRVSGTYAAPGDDFFDRGSLAMIYGGSIEHWLFDFIKLEAGVGFATHWIRSLDDTSREADLGVGVFSGLYVPFFQWGAHSFQVGLTYTPIFVRTDVFHAGFVSLNWQYL